MVSINMKISVCTLWVVQFNIVIGIKPHVEGFFENIAPRRMWAAGQLKPQAEADLRYHRHSILL